MSQKDFIGVIIRKILLQTDVCIVFTSYYDRVVAVPARMTSIHTVSRDGE